MFWTICNNHVCYQRSFSVVTTYLTIIDVQDFAHSSHFCSFLLSPHVVRYYGSYFKNSDLWIVMEYCGAGSVSDIIRIRSKTVRVNVAVARTDTHIGNTDSVSKGIDQS